MSGREIANSFGIIFLCGLIGLFFSITISVMNDKGMLVDEFITGTITLEEVMFVLFFVWVIIGLFIAFTRRE